MSETTTAVIEVIRDLLTRGGAPYREVHQGERIARPCGLRFSRPESCG